MSRPANQAESKFCGTREFYHLQERLGSEQRVAPNAKIGTTPCESLRWRRCQQSRNCSLGMIRRRARAKLVVRDFLLSPPTGDAFSMANLPRSVRKLLGLVVKRVAECSHGRSNDFNDGPDKAKNLGADSCARS